MTPLGIITGIAAGGVTTVVLSLLRPKSHLVRIGSAVAGAAVAYLVMTLL